MDSHSRRDHSDPDYIERAAPDHGNLRLEDQDSRSIKLEIEAYFRTLSSETGPILSLSDKTAHLHLF